jgi:hypothetical protein
LFSFFWIRYIFSISYCIGIFLRYFRFAFWNLKGCFIFCLTFKGWYTNSSRIYNHRVHRTLYWIWILSLSGSTINTHDWWISIVLSVTLPLCLSFPKAYKDCRFIRVCVLLTVSLDYPFLIVPSVYSNVYSLHVGIKTTITHLLTQIIFLSPFWCGSAQQPMIWCAKPHHMNVWSWGLVLIFMQELKK